MPPFPQPPAGDRTDGSTDRPPANDCRPAVSDYRTLDLMATSASSLPDAIEAALTRAASLVGPVDWFELRDLRGTVEDGHVGRWQVGVRIGYRETPPPVPAGRNPPLPWPVEGE